MKIGIIGTGYVGLVAGACFAESGNDVICADIVESKVARLNAGEVPIYEPGLDGLIESNVAAERLSFTTDVPACVRASDIVFIAVGTPPGEDGSADLQHVLAVARTIGQSMQGEKIVITKSTVPVGTARLVREAIEAETEHRVHVCSNPEFLKEGAAIDDFMKPDRVVLGVDSEFAADVLRDLYGPFLRKGSGVGRLLLMDVASAEITKYAANSMLATRISFMNSMARLCEATGADVDAVRQGVGSDERIGSSFLFPGAGYGGSCFEGSESVLVRAEGCTRLMRLDELFDERAPAPDSMPGDATPESVWVDDLDVLSWADGVGPVWRPAQFATRRWFEGDLCEVRTKLGRRVRCTPDHPFVVGDGGTGEPEVRLAGELGEADWLPLALGSAESENDGHDGFDLVGSLRRIGVAAEDVIVRIRRGAMRLPEAHVVGASLDGAALGTARNGTYVPPSIAMDEAFWRVVGLYLAEGHCSRDGRRMRLQWSFHPSKEPELVAEVADYWRAIGVKADIRMGSTTCNVVLSSRIMAAWWLRDLRLGRDCYTHRLPDAIWDRSESDQLALLSGLWHGDGSWSYVNGGPSVVLEWATVSRPLADGVVRLLGTLGVAVRMKVGRTAKSTTDTYWVVVSRAADVERLIELVKPADRGDVLASIGRQSKRIAPTGHRVARGSAWVRVTGVERAPFRGWVYSIEVPGTETLVTTAGLVAHNCFPKDVKALAKTMRDLGVDAAILEAVERVNETQKATLLARLDACMGNDLNGKTVAVWGLAFKPNTDDMREAPSLVTIAGLLERGARVVAHDPVAMDEARHHLGDRIGYAESNYDALDDAEALLIHTEWHPYRRPDFARMAAAMARPLIIDGRNLYDPVSVARHGFEYHSIGRRPMSPEGDGA